MVHFQGKQLSYFFSASLFHVINFKRKEFLLSEILSLCSKPLLGGGSAPSKANREITKAVSFVKMAENHGKQHTSFKNTVN